MADDPLANPPLLEVSGLKVCLGKPPSVVVAGIDFKIWPGEILGLAGESGSGKSITSMALTKLLPSAAWPTCEGTVSLKGIAGNILHKSPAVLRKIRGTRIAYVFQEPSSSFNPVYTIANQLEEVLSVAGIPRSERTGRIHQAMEEVGIRPTKENLQAYPASFSGGMLQRMSIACALASGPDLLIADEPTTALDTSTQKRIMELLLRLNQDHGLAILFISHNLGLLKQVASRLMVMRKGEIVEEGPTLTLLENPQHLYTQSLVDCIPKLVR